MLGNALPLSLASSKSSNRSVDGPIKPAMIRRRRMIARLFRLLDASPLPYADRLDLEAELIELLRPSSLLRPPPVVVVVHEDACGEHDTSIPS